MDINAICFLLALVVLGTCSSHGGPKLLLSNGVHSSDSTISYHNLTRRHPMRRNVKPPYNPGQPCVENTDVGQFAKILRPRDGWYGPADPSTIPLPGVRRDVVYLRSSKAPFTFFQMGYCLRQSLVARNREHVMDKLYPYESRLRYWPITITANGMEKTYSKSHVPFVRNGDKANGCIKCTKCLQSGLNCQGPGFYPFREPCRSCRQAKYQCLPQTFQAPSDKGKNPQAVEVAANDAGAKSDSVRDHNKSGSSEISTGLPAEEGAMASAAIPHEKFPADTSQNKVGGSHPVESDSMPQRARKVLVLRVPKLATIVAKESLNLPSKRVTTESVIEHNVAGANCMILNINIKPGGADVVDVKVQENDFGPYTTILNYCGDGNTLSQLVKDLLSDRTVQGQITDQGQVTHQEQVTHQGHQGHQAIEILRTEEQSLAMWLIASREIKTTRYGSKHKSFFSNTLRLLKALGSDIHERVYTIQTFANHVRWNVNQPEPNEIDSIVSQGLFSKTGNIMLIARENLEAVIGMDNTHYLPLSELVFQSWAELGTENGQEIQYIISAGITDDETCRVLLRIKKLLGGKVQMPIYLRYSDPKSAIKPPTYQNGADDILDALAGTPRGQTAFRMLADHPNAFGQRDILGAYIYMTEHESQQGPVGHPSEPAAPVIAWILSPPQQQQQQDLIDSKKQVPADLPQLRPSREQQPSHKQVSNQQVSNQQAPADVRLLQHSPEQKSSGQQAGADVALHQSPSLDAPQHQSQQDVRLGGCQRCGDRQQQESAQFHPMQPETGPEVPSGPRGEGPLDLTSGAPDNPGSNESEDDMPPPKRPRLSHGTH